MTSPERSSSPDPLTVRVLRRIKKDAADAISSFSDAQTGVLLVLVERGQLDVGALLRERVNQAFAAADRTRG